MDDLKNILVFVITIAFFIFSAIKKNKKKPVSKVGRVAQEIESFFGLQEDPDIKLQPESQADSAVSTFEFSNVEENKDMHVSEEGESTIPDEIVKTQITDIKNERNDFNLREAVIYSEILKRKEF